MESLQDSLAAWATILGGALSLLGLVQSRAWLTGISLVFVFVSISAGVYARRERLRVSAASLKIEGRSIDALNMANVRRRVNRSLVIQEAHQEARISGEDLRLIWRYAGYCAAKQESAIEFSIDSETNIPFETLNCFAYDLGRDPGRKHKIRPMLLGADGLSKKIAVPFLAPLGAEEAFCVLLLADLPGCMKAGVDYYTSTLSLAQEAVRQSTVRLVFVGKPPAWVRVYECGAWGRPKLLRDLRPVRQEKDLCEYLDSAKDVAGRSARIYLFSRDR